MKVDMDLSVDSSQKAKVMIGRPNKVRFNFGVVGETGAGRRTFIKAFTDPYDFNHADCEVHVVPDVDLVSGALRKKHNDWLDGYKNPATEEERNASDNRVHCIFYLFSPHRVLPEDKARILSLQGLVPIVPVLAKADAMTPSEREVQLVAVQQMMLEISSNAPLSVFFDFQEPEAAVSDDSSFLRSADELMAFKGLQDTHIKEGSPQDSDEKDKHSDRSYQFPVEMEQPGERSRSNSDATEESFKPVFQHHNTPLQTVDNLTMGESQLYSCAEEDSCPRHHHLSRSPDYSSDHRLSRAMPRLKNVFPVVCASNAEGLRVYPWGSVDTHNEAVSDLRRLQRLVFEQGSIGRLRALTQQMSIRQHTFNLVAKNGNRLRRDPQFAIILIMLLSFIGAGVCFLSAALAQKQRG